MKWPQNDKEDILHQAPLFGQWVMCLALAILGTLSQVGNAISEFGIRFVAGVVFIVFCGCCAYIRWKTGPSPIIDGRKVFKYSDRQRKTAGGFLVVIPIIAAMFIAITYWIPSDDSSDVSLEAIVDTPTEPGQYPSADDITEFPSSQDVEEPPAVDAKNVNFRYKNASGVDLRLLLFDFYYHYFPTDDPLAPTIAWRTWDFPATNRYLTTSDFRRGTGWYAFYVEDSTTGEQFELGTKNVFYSEWPTLTVISTGDSDEPFEAEFSTEE